MTHLELIINRPSYVPRPLRVLYGAATAVIWYCWLYLWLPLATFVAWTIGGLLGYHQMVALEGYRELIHLFKWYGLVILIMAGGLLLWATYNLLRFRGKERRGQLPDVALETYAADMQVTPNELAAWRHAKIVTVHHFANGQFDSVEVRLAAA